MFKDKVINVEGIDNSGSDTYRRFDYQIACVMETILTLSKSNTDFFVLLDYLDDYVIVENSGKKNESITFVQVKSKKDGPITINTVVKKEWIKKQVSNYHDFLDSSVKNILKTNFGIKLEDSTIIDSINYKPLSELEEEGKAKELVKQIKNELNGVGELDDFGLVCANLALNSLESHLIGYLNEYANNNSYQNLSVLAIKTIYEKLWLDLQKKQEYVPSDEEKKSFDTIYEKKGLNYSKVVDIFKTTRDIDIPEKKQIDAFYSKNHFNLGLFTYPEFLLNYHEFQTDTVLYGSELLLECCNFVKKYLDDIKKCSDIYEVSVLIKDILDKDIAVCDSEYYKKNSIYIAGHICFKMFYED